jgi:hydrogenase maturation protein HypF
MSSFARVSVVIRGAVQGVGFRPFVYRLATELALTGWICNSSEGVHIEAEGRKDVVDEFLIGLNKKHPPLASIHSLEYSFLDVVGFKTFEIRESDMQGTKRAVILPDIATCADCLHEIFDPSNRRYFYPFTNCTNCGPRFTIIESLPYDRANTTMRRFAMCVQCRAEYEDPENRRFHAQPNACPECGPQLQVWDTNGMAAAGHSNAISYAVDALKHGLVVAVKGLGGFHLIVDAADEQAVRRLRDLKHREAKPFAVMAPSLQSVRELCAVNSLEERLLCGPESPIVLLSRLGQAGIARSVAPDNPYLGVMLPYTPLHHLLMRELAKPVVATSGNRSDEPIAIDEYDAIRRLSGVADFFLVHNRPIRRHADDSIARIIMGREQIMRRARGYAPLPFACDRPAHSPALISSRLRPIGLAFGPLIAVGAHMKNTVALAAGPDIFLSQHIGDLETKEAFSAFRQVIDDFQTLYDAQPQCIAGDLHPDYASSAHASQIAKSRGIPFLRVQHHWAHVLSCMAENGVDSPALGVAWDGTGYGPDGTIWGGEFLLATGSDFQRVAHFRTFPLPGGDVSVRRPSHTAAGMLYEIFGTAAFTPEHPPLLRQILEKNIRSPRTSSAGRLFDSVAALTGFGDRLGFEGQAAMELEFAAAPGILDCYKYRIRDGTPYIIDWEPMLRQIIDDVRSGIQRGIISAKFHNTLAAMIVDIAQRIGEPKVVLTGGCFQNRLLTERTVERLAEAGFCAYWHQRVPPNDGGIAFGQAIAGRLMMQQEKSCALQSQEK